MVPKNSNYLKYWRKRQEIQQESSLRRSSRAFYRNDDRIANFDAMVLTGAFAQLYIERNERLRLERDFTNIPVLIKCLLMQVLMRLPCTWQPFAGCLLAGIQGGLIWLVNH